MGLFSTESLNSLEDLFVHQIKDLYDAEQRIADALPEMAHKAFSTQLSAAFEAHLSETQTHAARLERVFTLLGKKPERMKCDAVVGLLKECREVLDANGTEEVIDAGLIAAAQRVEHYEMAGYGAARSFAMRLGYTEAAELLQENLDDEHRANDLLTQIAETEVNEAAQTAQADY